MMRFQKQHLLLAILAANVHAFELGQQDKICSDCFEDIDEARDCLRDCNNEYKYVQDNKGNFLLVNGALVIDENWGSLLDYCLDDDSKDGADIEDIDDLVDCCGFSDKDCEKDLEDVKDCLTTCVHPCLTTTAKDWMDCVQDENDKGSCTRQDCLDGFLEDIEDEVDFGSSKDDIFSAKNLEKRFKTLAYTDLQDCDLLEEFVVEACDVGKTCCEKCNDHLAESLDCMLNVVVGPFVGAELNVTMPTCPVDEDCKMKHGFEFDNRKLQMLARDQKEAELFNKAISKITSNTGSRRSRLLSKLQQRQLDEGTVSSEEAVALCQEKMNADILTSNITHATNGYLECITASVLTSLDDPEVTTDSGAATAATLIAAQKILAMFAAMFYTFA